MLVLGIESTCDETACAIVEDGKRIISNVVSSQIDLHREYGGVVPELACRRHIDLMVPIIDKALKDGSLSLDDIDLFSVAHGPGLIGALLIGLTTAKGLALSLNKPFIGVNHIEAHLYAAMMEVPTVSFPALGVVISGGHTSLLLIHEIGRYSLIGQTVDDAIGEAFDKVAKMLDLPYPGGPEIEKLATEGNPFAYDFKGGRVKGRPFDFSFSGLKTAVLYSLKGQNAAVPICVSDEVKRNIAASFQQAALQDVVSKTLAVAAKFDCKQIFFGGGVSNNQRLRQMFANQAQSLSLHWPPQGLSLDNAAMIAGLAFHQFKKDKIGASLSLEALPRIPF
jgi:N6-L-threonylcarbamoyladenine synthase